MVRGGGIIRSWEVLIRVVRTALGLLEELGIELSGVTATPAQMVEAYSMMRQRMVCIIKPLVLNASLLLGEIKRFRVLLIPVMCLAKFSLASSILTLGLTFLSETERLLVSSEFRREKVKTIIKLNSCQVIYSQFGLAIHQNDHQARHRFVEWAQNEIAVVPDFHKRNLLSDEAHLWLNGYVNKQNCRIWSEANPQVYVETPLHPEKLTVWCALWAGGILLQKR
ncbi:transposase [Trichonephila clavipes]|nr:transposase [Trichonephila clavipes]